MNEDNGGLLARGWRKTEAVDIVAWLGKPKKGRLLAVTAGSSMVAMIRTGQPQGDR